MQGQKMKFAVGDNVVLSSKNNRIAKMLRALGTYCELGTGIVTYVDGCDYLVDFGNGHCYYFRGVELTLAPSTQLICGK